MSLQLDVRRSRDATIDAVKCTPHVLLSETTSAAPHSFRITTQSAQLEYAPRRSYVRRQWRRLTIIVVSIIAATCVFVWQDKLRNYAAHLRFLQTQRVWLNYEI